MFIAFEFIFCQKHLLEHQDIRNYFSRYRIRLIKNSQKRDQHNDADLDDLHVGAEEEEVGGGGNPVVVDVVAPGPTLPHLGALQAICFHHLNTT
jgi:hypothetical protein